VTRRWMHGVVVALLVGVPQARATDGVQVASVAPGTLQGRVVDAEGAPVVGARVRLFVDDEARPTGTTTTDSAGHYRFQGLDRGPWRVMVTHASHSPRMRFDLQLQPDAGVFVEMVLQPRFVESIVSGGQRSSPPKAVLDGATVTDPVTGTFGNQFEFTESGTVGQPLTREHLDRIPSGRSYQEAVVVSRGRGRPARPWYRTPAAAAPRPTPALPDAPGVDPAGQDRLLARSGRMVTASDDPSTTLGQAAAIATDVGGRVTGRTADTVLLRVPDDRFDEAWAAVLGLGEVQAKSLRTEDLTARIQDTALRIEVLRALRDRMVALLAQTPEDADAVRLLRDLREVEASLAALEARSLRLRRAVAFDRIAVRAVRRPPVRVVDLAQRRGLDWLRALSPERMWGKGMRTEAPAIVPDGFARVAGQVAHAAAPDSSRLWASSVVNEPAGDGAFWASAVGTHLRARGLAVEEVAHGAWSCVVTRPEQADWDTWWVCVRADERAHRAQVIQAAFRPGASIGLHALAMGRALQGGE